MPRILFIAAHRPDRSPSQRYRYEQFVPYWERKGFTFDYAWLLDEADDGPFYAKGNILSKARIFLKSWWRRRKHVGLARQADLVLLQREAFMTGSTRFEKALAHTGVPVIYDFDDAIWLLDVSEGNRHLRWLKDPGKTDRILGLADHVIAGNEFLAEYARRFNPAVEVIPTVVDTHRYTYDRKIGGDGPVVIGWTGSHTSMTHLKRALPMLHEIQKRFGDAVEIRVISDRDLVEPGLKVTNVPWRSATEAEDLQTIDIGIMPLPDNDWSRGKCGFKGLQYMALGKAVVLQNVGVNPTIVQHEENGLLASTHEEWVEALGRLIADPELRHRLGAKARRTVEEKWSVDAWKDRYVELFHEVLSR